MGSDPPELGKGLFGYRKSAVNQIIADRDIMLRQAEGRVRAAESKVAELESELISMRDRNTRMDEQLERLRQQLDTLVGQGVPAASVEAPPAPTRTGDQVEATAMAPSAAEQLAPYEQPAPHEVPAPHEEPMAASWEEQPATPTEPAYPSYREDETPQHEAEAEEPWTSAEHAWSGMPEGSAEVGAGEAEPPAETISERDLPYGAEVRLRHDEPAERPSAAWMHTGPESVEEHEEQDEVAMAGYGFEDYGTGGQESYGEFGAAEEEGESPSPFSRFPFASEPFEQEPVDMAEAADEADEAGGPVAPGYDEPPMETPSQPAWEAPSTEAVAKPAAPPPAVSAETADITNRFLTEELAGILAAAEESAARIVERARATTQRQIARSNRVWRDVQAEVSRFAAWRQEVEPLIRGVQSKVEGARSEIEEVPERIRQALAPMADAISAIDADLAELASASNPPLLLAPSGLESEGSDVESWDLQDQEGDEFGSSGDTSDPSNEGSGHLHAG